MANKKDQLKTKEITETPSEPKYKYMCHGCTNDAGHFDNPALNQIIICSHCGMEQLSVLENFIAL